MNELLPQTAKRSDEEPPADDKRSPTTVWSPNPASEEGERALPLEETRGLETMTSSNNEGPPRLPSPDTPWFSSNLRNQDKRGKNISPKVFPLKEKTHPGSLPPETEPGNNKERRRFNEETKKTTSRGRTSKPRGLKTSGWKDHSEGRTLAREKVRYTDVLSRKVRSHWNTVLGSTTYPKLGGQRVQHQRPHNPSTVDEGRYRKMSVRIRTVRSTRNCTKWWSDFITAIKSRA